MRRTIENVIVYLSFMLLRCVFVLKKVFHVGKFLDLIRLGFWRAKRLSIGKCVHIDVNVIIKRPECVVVGDSVKIGSFVHIWGGGGVEIGKNSLIASHCVLTSQTHSINGGLYQGSSEAKPIKLGDNVWLGAGVIVLPGVEIGNNSVIGAGSVVTKNVPSNCIVVGVPAVVQRYIDVRECDD